MNFFSFLLTLAILVPLTSHAGQMDHAAWWVSNYHTISAQKDPWVSRAENVFSRVLAAADKTGNRYPKLVILKSETNPWAVSIRDGSILISRGVLDICYQGQNLETGDSRLAFVLGHELAHLAKDDFWHMAAFSALKTHGGKESKALLTLLENTSDVHGGEDAQAERRVKELRADAYGILYMTMAGYNPQEILSDGNDNFFQDWVKQVTGKAAYSDPTHPDPVHRAEFVKIQLSKVAEDLSFFSFGVRLVQLGRYEEGILFLESFQEVFPSREVFNNLGIAHYFMAFASLIHCDAAHALRFYLPLRLDENTLAQSTNGRSRGGGDCTNDPIFNQHIKEAIQYFEQAIQKDPQYIPARINLGAALVLIGRYPQAMNLADEILRIDPGNNNAKLIKSLGIYLFGQQNGIPTENQAVETLRNITQEIPEWAPAWYNLARILDETKQAGGNTACWKNYFSTEPYGIYTRYMNTILNRKSKTPVRQTVSHLLSPIPLGEPTNASAKCLTGYQKREFSLGDFDGTFYIGKGIEILELDFSLEMAIVSPQEPMREEEFKEKYGEPDRIVKNCTSTTLIYKTFAVDIVSGQVQKIIFANINTNTSI